MCGGCLVCICAIMNQWFHSMWTFLFLKVQKSVCFLSNHKIVSRPTCRSSTEAKFEYFLCILCDHICLGCFQFIYIWLLKNKWNTLHENNETICIKYRKLWTKLVGFIIRASWYKHFYFLTANTVNCPFKTGQMFRVFFFFCNILRHYLIIMSFHKLNSTIKSILLKIETVPIWH